MNLKEAAWFFFPFLKIFMGISLIYHVVLVSSVQQSIILQLFPIFVLFQANGQCLLGAFDSLHGCDCSFWFFFLWIRVIIVGAHHLFLNLLRIIFV